MQRKTSQRSAIEQVFLEEDRPLGIDEILQQARARVEEILAEDASNTEALKMRAAWLIRERAITQLPSVSTLYALRQFAPQQFQAQTIEMTQEFRQRCPQAVLDHGEA